MLRFILAVIISKLSKIALRLLGRSATYLPGSIALKICPSFISRVKKPKRIIAVTGTNGKTTVSNLLCDVLSAGGYRVLHNRLGSNVAAGIASSLLDGAVGNKHDTAVLEVDERSSARILPHIKPELLIVTNLFQDSLMRNAHPEYIAGIISQNVPPETRLILNADEMISSAIAPENKRVYFGIAENPSDGYNGLGAERRICPVCASSLEFDYRRYLHLGRVHCTKCDFKSPEYDYTGVISPEGSLTISHKNGEKTFKLLSDSMHNIYNMVTVTAALCEFGLTFDEIAAGFSGAGIVETRYNEDTETPVTIVMHLAKAGNPSANSRAFEYVSGKLGDKELILMNNLRDHKNWSENICWLYDADFEFLNKPDIKRIILTGPRAEDYYLRLIIAGVPESRLVCVYDDMKAAEMLEITSGSSVFIFYGTDTIGLARNVRDAVKARAGGLNNAKA